MSMVTRIVEDKMTYYIQIDDEVREATAKEIAEIELKAANAQAELAEAEAKAQAKATAEGKLAALGLTTDDLRALGLQPVNETLAMCSWCTVKGTN